MKKSNKEKKNKDPCVCLFITNCHINCYFLDEVCTNWRKRKCNKLKKTEAQISKLIMKIIINLKKISKINNRNKENLKEK